MKKILFLLLLLVPFLGIGQGIKRISDLPPASNLTGAYIPIIQNGANLKASSTLFTNSGLSLTTIGNSGPSTFTINTGTLNIPNYTLSGLGGISLASLSATLPLVYNNITGVFSIPSWPANASGVLTNDGSGVLSWAVPISSFQLLTDGPGSFSAHGLNYTRVNSGATALEYRTPSQVLSDIGGQALLISGTNIKTVNSSSLLGSGNLAVGDALIANPLSQFASTTSAQLRGVLSDELGTGVALFDGATPTSFVGTNITGTASGLTAGNVPLSGITGLGSNWPTALGASLGSGWTTALNGAYSAGTTSTADESTLHLTGSQFSIKSSFYSTTPTASILPQWDANKNLSANSFITGYTTTATAAGTTTLTASSTFYQDFTGSATQTVVLPVTSTLIQGFSFLIRNKSSQPITIQSSGGNTIQIMDPLTELKIKCISTSGTGTSSWDWNFGFVANYSLPFTRQIPVYTYGKKIVWYGDSYTFGTGASITANRFASLVSSRMGATEINNAVSGTTLEKGTPLNPFGSTPNMVDNVSTIPTKDNTYALLVICYGVNDAGWNGGTYNPANFVIDYQTVLNAAFAKGWDASQILIVAPYFVSNTGRNLYHTSSGNPKPAISWFKAFADAAEYVASTNKTLFNHTYNHQLLNDTTSTVFNGDGLHPNDAGHQFIANDILNCLQGGQVRNGTFTSDIFKATNSTQSSLFFGSGGSFYSLANNSMAMFGGAYYNGSNFIALGTNASAITIGNNNGFTFYSNTGLTIGNSFSVTQIALLTSTGLFLGGSSTPNSRLQLAANTTTIPQLILTNNGSVLTSPLAGAIENVTDDLFYTINTGTARKRLLMADASGGLTSGRIPVATTNGRLIDFSSFLFDTTNGLQALGTTTNNNATAGNIGESVSSLVATGSAVSLTTATSANVTSISLTAGDWDVEGLVNYKETTSTVTARSASTGSTSATLATDGTEGNNGVQSTVTSEVNTITLPPKRFSLSGTTTVYLVAQATFSAGTCGAYGYITARRVR